MDHITLLALVESAQDLAPPPPPHHHHYHYHDHPLNHRNPTNPCVAPIAMTYLTPPKGNQEHGTVEQGKAVISGQRKEAEK